MIKYILKNIKALRSDSCMNLQKQIKRKEEKKGEYHKWLDFKVLFEKQPNL